MLDYTQQLRNVNLNKINTENIMYEYICIPAYVPAVQYFVIALNWRF